MSFDLLIWSDEADPNHDPRTIMSRYQAATARRTAPSPHITALVESLLELYPDIGTEAGEDSPWASGPLMNDASGGWLYLSLLTGTEEVVYDRVLAVVQAHALNCFEPQSGTLLAEAGAPRRRRSLFGGYRRNRAITLPARARASAPTTPAVTGPSPRQLRLDVVARSAHPWVPRERSTLGEFDIVNEHGMQFTCVLGTSDAVTPWLIVSHPAVTEIAHAMTAPLGWDVSSPYRLSYYELLGLDGRQPPTGAYNLENEAGRARLVADLDTVAWGYFQARSTLELQRACLQQPQRQTAQSTVAVMFSLVGLAYVLEGPAAARDAVDRVQPRMSERQRNLFDKADFSVLT